jgi:hypothetical protein
LRSAALVAFTSLDQAVVRRLSPSVVGVLTSSRRRLTRLACSDDPVVLKAVAGNPASPPEVLELLAAHLLASAWPADDGLPSPPWARCSPVLDVLFDRHVSGALPVAVTC